MFAGGPAINDSANTSPQLIRFAVKANRVEYDYVAKNQYYLPGNVKTAAANNVQAYTKHPPIAPKPPFISFPAGTVEIKSAWRPLNGNDNPAHFHMQTVRFYENKGSGNTPCYFEQQWGLIALHIIQKTPSAPAFIYATFEQAENIRQPSGAPVEDADGNVTNPIPGAAPTTPVMAYRDLPTAPKVTAKGAFCTPQSNLYFKDSAKQSGLTGGGAICVNQRYEPIPSDVIAVNKAAHQAIADYDAAQGISNSPWSYYKLVSVQPSPFDHSAISPHRFRPRRGGVLPGQYRGRDQLHAAAIPGTHLRQPAGYRCAHRRDRARRPAAERRHAATKLPHGRRRQHGRLHGLPRQRAGQQRHRLQLHSGGGLRSRA